VGGRVKRSIAAKNKGEEGEGIRDRNPDLSLCSLSMYTVVVQGFTSMSVMSSVIVVFLDRYDSSFVRLFCFGVISSTIFTF